MAMQGKAEIQVGVKIISTKASLQGQLDNISKGLQVEAKAAKQSLATNKQKSLFLDKMINQYKTHKKTFQELDKYATQLLRSERFRNMSAKEQADIYKKLEGIEKNRNKQVNENYKVEKKLLNEQSKKNNEIIKQGEIKRKQEIANTESNKKRIGSVDKLIKRYDMQQISYEKLQEYSKRILESERFQKKSIEDKAKVYKKLESVDKARTKQLDYESNIRKGITAEKNKALEINKYDARVSKAIEQSELNRRKRYQDWNRAQDEAINKAKDDAYKEQLANEKRLEAQKEKARKADEKEREKRRKEHNANKKARKKEELDKLKRQKKISDAQFKQEYKKFEQGLNRIDKIQTKIVGKKSTGQGMRLFDTKEVSTEMNKLNKMMDSFGTKGGSSISKINKQYEVLNGKIKDTMDVEKAHGKAIEMNKKVDADRLEASQKKTKQHNLLAQREQKAVKKMNMARRTSTESMDKLVARYKTGNITQKQFEEYSKRIVNSERHKNKTWQTQAKVMKKMKNAMSDMDEGQFTFNKMLGEGIKKMLVWSATATILYAPLRAFQSGLQILKEIDTALVDIAKVTNLTADEMEDLAMRASDVGIALGRTTQEYLQAVTEFSRAGYGTVAEDLAKVSLLLQNVGDVNTDTANSFLLATDAAYKLGGSEKELTNVVNGLNKISNENATSIDKVAEGMSVSASIANQAGVDIEELSGAISTMTIVSQRSGAEAKLTTSLYGDI